MLELQKIRKDINWLLEQIKCLMKKSDADCPLEATEWSPNHSVATGNPYILGCFVWLNGHVYESLIDDNTYPPTNDCYWTDLGEGHLLLEEQSNWNATTGRAFIRNKPTNTSDFVNDGEDGSSPFATLNDLSAAIPLAQDLESVLTEGDTAADKQVNVESVGLWDNYSGPYGFARIYADKARIWFQSKTGVIMASIRANAIAFKTGIYEYNINVPNATGNRTATFQNASGIIAYLSDIPTSMPQDMVATIWSPYHTAGTGNPYLTGTRVFYNGHVYQALHDNDGIVPTNVTYWLDLGAGYLLDQELTPVVAPFNLDETLQEGNISQRDANIGILGLWQSDVDNGDGTFGSYGYISLYSDPAAPTISYAYIRGGGLDTPVLFQSSDNGLVHFKNGHHNPIFDFSAITDNRTWNWRDMDGVVAFLSDITAQINADWNATSGVAQILNKPNIPAAQVNSDWNATSGIAQILNKPTIPAAITNTSQLINDGDNGVSHFISLEDLPANLILYPTNVISTVPGYYKLVSSITDPSFNTVAVNIPTGTIVASNQFIAALVSAPGLIVGNPGVFNMTTIGNIHKLSGTGDAEFYFEVYKRTSAGVETLITVSGSTLPVVNSGYAEFSASALFVGTNFTSTDRIVTKFYGTHIHGGSNPSFEFQFGGITPIRTLVPVPLTVVPAVNLSQLLDVSVLSPVTGDNLVWNSVTNLWENKSVATTLGYTPADDATFLYNKYMTNHFSYMLPGENSTYNLLRTNTTAGYITAGTVATLAQMPMGISYTTGIATSSIAAVFGAPMKIQLSNTQDFTFQRKWKIQITSTVQRYFVGITNKYITATPVNADQSLFLNVLGVVKIDTSNNWFFIYNDGTGVATLIDCGVNFPATNAYTYSLKIQKIKGATSLTITLTRIDNTTGATLSVSQVVNSTDYNTGVEYNPAIWVSNHTAPSGSQFYDYGCMLLKSTI